MRRRVGEPEDNELESGEPYSEQAEGNLMW